MKRREFVIKTAMMGMMTPLAAQVKTFSASAQAEKKGNTICSFSKPFTWMGYDDLSSHYEKWFQQ